MTFRVALTEHARERIARRLKNDGDWVIAQVRLAAEEKRFTRRRPSWVHGPRSHPAKDGYRYVRFTDHGAQAMAVVHVNDDNGTVLIVTVVRRGFQGASPKRHRHSDLPKTENRSKALRRREWEDISDAG